MLVVVMLAVSGIGELEVKAEEIQQETVDLPVNPNPEAPEEPVIKQEQLIEIKEIEQELTLYVNDEFQMEIIQTGDGALTYESSNLEVLEVDETGLLKAIKEGEAELIIRAAETETYQDLLL